MGGFLMAVPVVLPFAFAALIGSKRYACKGCVNTIAGTAVILNLIFLVLILGMDFQKSIEIVRLNENLRIFLDIDRIGALFAVLASSLWLFTAFYSMGYMKHEEGQTRFFAFFTATLGVTSGIAFSGNLMTLYLFYELLTIVTYPLVIHTQNEEAFESGRRYLAYSFGGAALVLAGMALLYSISPNLDFAAGNMAYAPEDRATLLYAFMMLFIGFGVKAAVVPLHSWLPSAMVAPTPVSSLLHAVAVVKSGVFSIIRVVFFIFGADAVRDINGQIYAGAFVAVTILMGSLLAMTHDNLKKRLAYSTISQLGYILLGVFMLNEKALEGGLLHLVNHALIKIVLFFCAGAIYVNTHKKKLSELKGIGKSMPVTMTCFSIAAVSLIGIPPTSGFVSKWYLAIGSIGAGRVWFAVVLLLSAVLTAAYLLPIIIAAFFSSDECDSGSTLVKKEAEGKMLAPIVMLTAVIVLTGIFPSIVLGFIERIVSDISF
ncbi:NADH-quinone oxidoreductase subunit N (plasmid) [Peptoclostridium acidaminophilum DSM 3953]|uniref:NADH-quinone oxidoreductase subunit N n=1 Tax=Peptoclostridium acidaminophilum DSM 3953 TaxID=1286171 RepID=W8TJ61_PEPAC|nr:proton-conducting transporter membrane subunit [Peptoclostridium acidaminophilum]AHM57828.1 NADH-quinone oxidoreductase subunit N [Peptoclostridium acidaminophilum DSM 3953]